jgi:hypothetical protein
MTVATVRMPATPSASRRLEELTTGMPLDQLAQHGTGRRTVLVPRVCIQRGQEVAGDLAHRLGRTAGGMGHQQRPAAIAGAGHCSVHGHPAQQGHPGRPDRPLAGDAREDLDRLPAMG